MKRVVIIGGGVVGLCAAWYCREKGHEVIVLERGSPERDCCSLGNAGLIVPSHIIPLAAPGMVSMGFKMMWNPESPFYIKPRISADLFDWGLKFIRACTPEHVRRSAPLLLELNLASKRLFEEFDALPEMNFGFEKRGLVNLCKTDERLAEESEMAERARELNMPAEVLSADETRKLDPSVTMDCIGSVYFPEDAHLSPGRFMHQLAGLLVKRGVQIEWNARVVGWTKCGDSIKAAKTAGREFSGDEFVVAGGAWSPQLTREFDLKIPIQAGKGYSLSMKNPVELPSLSYIFTEARLAITPMMGELRFGGTMEISGLDTKISASRIRGITQSVEQYFPKFPPNCFDRIEPWSGLRPCSPDGLPYLGRTRTAPNLTLAAGHAMMGLSMGPISGKLVAEAVSDETPTINLELARPDRYSR